MERLQTVPHHRSGPRMAARIVARAIFMRRQRDGLGTGVAVSRGGRVRDLPGNLFSDDGDDQPCVDPRSRQLWLLGRQHVEAGQALEPFERQLNLPAKAIEGEDVGRREGGGRQRGKKKNVLRRFETALRGSGCLPRFLASLSSRFCSASACSGSLRRTTSRSISGSGGGAPVMPSCMRTCTSPSSAF